jgi:hypothetical protein
MRAQLLPLAIVHLIGNALILWLGYYWLGIGESNGTHLALSALIVLLFILSALWLHGTALVVLNGEARRAFPGAAKMVARHLIPLLALAIIAIAIYWSLAWLYDQFGHKAFIVGSFLTLHLRKPIAPGRVLAWYHSLIWLFRWVIVPVILLPVAAKTALRGWRGYKLRSLRRSRNVLYWMEVCALLLLAVWAPLRLLQWKPEFTNFSAQMASFVARFGVGYFLFVAALLSVEYFTSAGNPRSTQRTRVVSP